MEPEAGNGSGFGGCMCQGFGAFELRGFIKVESDVKASKPGHGVSGEFDRPLSPRAECLKQRPNTNAHLDGLTASRAQPVEPNPEKTYTLGLRV